MGSMAGFAQRVAMSPQPWSGVTIDAVARKNDKKKKPDMNVKITNPE